MQRQSNTPEDEHSRRLVVEFKPYGSDESEWIEADSFNVPGYNQIFIEFDAESEPDLATSAILMNGNSICNQQKEIDGKSKSEGLFRFYPFKPIGNAKYVFKAKLIGKDTLYLQKEVYLYIKE